METRNCHSWSELPVDILRYLLERLSFIDFHRSKMVCSNWYLCSKQTLRPKSGSPLLMLSPEEGGCRLYNPPEKNKVYETKNDLSGYRFLGNSGKWFLGVDSRSDLYIIDVFSEERIRDIRLPVLETIKGGLYKVERVGYNEFKDNLISVYHSTSWSLLTSKNLRGLLWVDDKNGDYVVVWKFEQGQYLGYCKKGDLHYREIPIRMDVRRELQGLHDVVLKGYHLYILATRDYIRHLDLSGQDGFEDVSVISKMWMPWLRKSDFEIMKTNKVISYGDNIAVTTSGEVLFVYTRAYDPVCERPRIFRVYKREPNELDDTKLVEVESIDDEALFIDLGITVPADHTLGIEPNSIYFTSNDRFGHKKRSTPCLIDICVYNIATKTIKRFPSLSNLKLKDAQWFLPS